MRERELARQQKAQEAAVGQSAPANFYACTSSGLDKYIVLMYVRQASHYTIFSLQRTVIAPHDAYVITKSCSVRPFAIPSITILKIGGDRRPS